MLLQDPNTIKHKQAPVIGDVYAVTDKKPKKKKGCEEQPMYSIPDKSKKNPQEVSFREISFVNKHVCLKVINA